MVTAFYQPSTRTRLAHEAAMHRLGGAVTGFSDAKMTRAGDFYQESIKDTVHMLEYYGDVIVMRHFEQGAPHEAAKWASIPVINAGDGWGEHPTQVLTDLYTVHKEKGTLDGKTFVAIGDHRMRTMHSIGYALSQFDAEMVILSPEEMSPTDLSSSPNSMRRAPTTASSPTSTKSSPRPMSSTWSPSSSRTTPRSQSRRNRTTTASRRTTTRSSQEVMKRAKGDSIILHSLPRMDELLPEVDHLKHARYWQEAYNGVVMRMALLSLVLGATE